ncbi:C2H2-like zinc finger protein [Striga hermonthica]|uniref:C2H2-like zinc finger protein n=1 Tax=Striga hermonthica TaxID=68872 RepID=A0A9N7RFT7_STRHE|nr:C2H2-like zinc finger protein [Striga hermonthica]
MVRTGDGAYAAKAKKVVVLWDLDNKPPRGPPYEAAVALRSVAQRFGDVVDVSAYANHHAFSHLPQWVVEERRERRRLDVLERRGAVSDDTYACSVCGRKFKTNLELKKHFKQLHLRERQKKLNRMRSLKGKKRQRFKEKFIDGNEKYNEAARSLLTPKVGYRLAQELRRAGVHVRTVQDKPQAADWALKRQMAHSMSRGVDWIVLVSDDSDFSEMLRKAREASLGTVVIGDRDRALGRHADVWVPWVRVENGEIEETDLELRREGWSFSVVGDVEFVEEEEEDDEDSEVEEFEQENYFFL